MSEQCIEIFRPVQSSKLHRHWVALVGGVELSGDSEKEVQEKAIAFVLSDPIIKAEVSERERLARLDERQNYDSCGCYQRVGEPPFTCERCAALEREQPKP